MELSSQINAGDKPSKPPEPRSQAVSDQIALLRKDLSGLAETVTGMTKAEIAEKIGDAQTVAADKASELQANIRSNPMQAAAIAAGIGFVLGLLLTR